MTGADKKEAPDETAEKIAARIQSVLTAEIAQRRRTAATQENTVVRLTAELLVKIQREIGALAEAVTEYENQLATAKQIEALATVFTQVQTEIVKLPAAVWQSVVTKTGTSEIKLKVKKITRVRGAAKNNATRGAALPPEKVAAWIVELKAAPTSEAATAMLLDAKLKNAELLQVARQVGVSGSGSNKRKLVEHIVNQTVGAAVLARVMGGK
jgi:hypothetical protein